MLLLEKLLLGMHVQVQPFSVVRVKAHARLTLAPAPETRIYYLLRGAAALKLGCRRFDVDTGTVIILPREQPGELSSRQVPERVGSRDAGPGDRGVVVASAPSGASYRQRDLFALLPEAIIERTEPGDAVRDIFERLLSEQTVRGPGFEAMSNALMQQCLIMLLRTHCANGAGHVPWLLALEHAKLGKTIEHVLANPGRHYTLADLAAIARMSRSAFCDHFQRTFGRPPMDFIQEARLRQAASLLQDSERPVKSIAAQVGYQSRSHFSQAFKSLFGVSPAGYRQKAQ